MRHLKSIAAAALLALASTAAIAATDIVTEPDWLAKPNGNDLSQAYPSLAQRFQIEGKAIITCRVDAVGKLSACKVDAETPRGLGFGDAALSMSRAFQMRPQSVNGKFVEGGEVAIPLRFRLPQQPEPPTPPPPRSPRALELARKLVGMSASNDPGAAQIEAMAFQLDAAKGGVPAFSRIATALRESFPPRAVQMREFSAKLMASAFGEAELETLVAYLSTPAGSLQISPAAEDRKMLARLSQEFDRAARTRAKEFFCQNAGCLKQGEDPFPPSSDDVIVAPIWSQQPDREIVQQFLPAAAKGLRIPGAVRLICIVGPLGVMENCSVASEAPRGLGFAGGAKSLARYYRLSSEQLKYGTVGKAVAIDTRFEDAPADAAAPMPKVEARSQSALALARELVSRQSDDRAMQSALRGLLEEQRSLSASFGLTPADFDKLTDAYARGIQAAVEQRREADAAYVTTRLSDKQIAAAIEFWRSPAGQTWKAKSPAVLAQAASATAVYGRLVMADAGRAFCKVDDCEGANLKRPANGKSAQPPISPNSAPATRTP